jgi:hypothetical protein
MVKDQPSAQHQGLNRRTTMNAAQEMIRDAMRNAETSDAGIQPSVLMHKNIDHDLVGEYTNCYVNGSWATKLKELIDDGWIVFRIQTEFSSLGGHMTYAYLAKLKTN